MSDFPKNPNAVGTPLIRVLTEKLSKHSEEFRSATVTTGDGELVTLDTKGGNPRILKSKTPKSASCKLFPLKEVDDVGDATQDVRLYYHDHEADENVPERLTYTTDGLFSLIARPLKRILLKSSGLGKNLDVWFVDPTVEANKHPLKLENLKELDLEALDPDKTLRLEGVTCSEILKRDTGSKPYRTDELALEDDADGKALRRYYAPTLLTSKSPKDEGDEADYKGLGFLLARLKQLVFSVTGAGKYDGRHKVTFSRYNNNLRKADSTGNGGVADEKNLLRREYEADAGNDPALRTVTFVQGKLTLAPPGGLLQHNEPARFGQVIKPSERTVKHDESVEYIVFDDISHCITFGQYRHGPFKHSTRELFTDGYTAVQLTLTGDDSSAFDIAANNPATVQYVCFYDSAEVDGDSMLPKNTNYNDESLKDIVDLRKGAVLLMGRYGLSATSPKVFGAESGYLSQSLSFPIKNEDGSVHRISVSFNDLNGVSSATYKGRTDKYLFEATHATDNVLLGTSPGFTVPPEYDMWQVGWLTGFYRRQIAHSPNGRKCVAGARLLTFTGDGGDDLAVSFATAYTPIWVRRQYPKKRTPEEIAEIPDTIGGHDTNLSGEYISTTVRVIQSQNPAIWLPDPPINSTSTNKAGLWGSFVRTSVVASDQRSMTTTGISSGNVRSGSGGVTYNSSSSYVPGGVGGTTTTVYTTVGSYEFTRIRDTRLFNPYGHYLPRYGYCELIDYYYDRVADKFKPLEFVYKHWQVTTRTSKADSFSLTKTTIIDNTSGTSVVTESGTDLFQSQYLEEIKYFAEVEITLDGVPVITRKWEQLAFTKESSVQTRDPIYPDDDSVIYPGSGVWHYTGSDQPAWGVYEHYILGASSFTRHAAESPVVVKLVWPGAPDTYIYGSQTITLNAGETLHYDPWTNTIGKNTFGVQIIF